MRLFAALLLVVGSTGAQERLGFKDLEIGKPFARAASMKDMTCAPYQEAGRKICHYLAAHSARKETIGGRPVQSVSVVTMAGVIQSVLVSFKADGFDDVRDAVASKYQDIRCQPSTVQNRMGAVFDQVQCEASRPEGVLILQKRIQTVDDSMLFIESAAERSRGGKRSATAKKDL